MIKLQSEFDLPLTQDIVELYNNYCEFPFKNNVFAPIGFEENIKLIYNKHNLPQPNINNIPYIKQNFQNNCNNNQIIIGSSGGLDSTYAILKAIDDGRNVTLVHFQNLNKNYPKETEHIKSLAIHKNLKLYIINVKHYDKDYFPDNPFKNQLILCALSEIGSLLNIKNIMLGATGTYHITDSVIGINVTDTIENYNTFLNGLKLYYPQINIIYLPSNITKYKMMKYIINNHPDIINDIYSCISPNRFVKMLHDQNENKYNIKLLKDRCGSCYKCCMEYIYLYECGYYNNIEFLNHCYHILAKSKNSHRPELFSLKLPYETRRNNVLEYKPE